MSMIDMSFDERLRPMLEVMAREGMKKAARGLSDMVGKSFTFDEPSVKLVPLEDIPEMLGGPENEAVGIYLLAEGDMAGQIMLILPLDKAHELADLLLGEPLGTTMELDSLARSALAEVGNLMGTFFLNAVASITGLSTRPSPPAVMVDMVGAILNVIIATSGVLADKVLMFQANLSDGERVVLADFWVLPDPKVLSAFLDGRIAGDQ